MLDPIQLRTILKAYSIHEKYDQPSDQQKGLPQPPLQKEVPQEAIVLDLPDPHPVCLTQPDIRQCFIRRISHRIFTDEPLSMNELSFLLWATQGVKQRDPKNYYTKRTVPSAGARHPFETYIAVFKVENLKPGIYRYLALSHQIIFSHEVQSMRDELIDATCGQKFCGDTAVVFFWAAVPYRMEWRYLEHAAKAILLDAGHVGQNLYLACEALSLGTCGIGAYAQEVIDEMLKIDGQDEFVVYLAPVGRIQKP